MASRLPSSLRSRTSHVFLGSSSLSLYKSQGTLMYNLLRQNNRPSSRFFGVRSGGKQLLFKFEEMNIPTVIKVGVPVGLMVALAAKLVLQGGGKYFPLLLL